MEPDATKPAGPTRSRRLLGAAAAAFLLALFSQIAATPMGEGMDVDRHLAYVAFVARERRPPLTGESSVPADIAALREHRLASDYISPGSYERWARLTPAERAAERRLWLVPQLEAPYVSANYQAQHPPLYYLLAAGLDVPIRRLPYDTQVFWLSVLSAILATSAVPALWILFRRRLDAAPALALVTAVAWFPNLLPFLGRPTNDALAFPLACWFFCVIDQPRLRRRDVIGGAALLVAGLLTKTYFVALIPAFLAASALRGSSSGRPSVSMLGLGAVVLTVGVVPLLVANYTTSGMLFPLLEAQLTVGEPVWRKLAGLFMVDWVRFPTLMARGFFWSGYWSFVAPGPWYYLPMVAPFALLLPWPVRPGGTGRQSWWRVTLAETWVHLLGWGVFLAAMWWHAGLFALGASAHHPAQVMGGEGWYLNVLIASSATILAVSLRERYGASVLTPLLTLLAAGSIVWNLVARATLYAFWGGSVRLWSGLRFAWFGDVVRALGSAATWSAWQSWPGVVGPAWLTQALPLALALGASAWVLWSCLHSDAAQADARSAFTPGVDR